MIWLIVAAVWLLPGLYLGPRAARAWYADELRYHLDHVAEVKASKAAPGYYYHYSGCDECERPERARAGWIGVAQVFIWPASYTFRGAQWVVGRLGGVTFDGIEERVKTDIEVAKQLKKMQHTEKFRKELELLAFDQRTVSTADEAWRHNNKVELLLQKMTLSNSPLEAIDVQLLQERYKIDAESIKELEVSK